MKCKIVTLANGKQCPVYPIGTQFRSRGKADQPLQTVIDHLATYNSKMELVKFRYVTEYSFCGQTVRDHDVVGTSIARGLDA